MATTFCQSGAVIAKVGVGVNDEISGGSLIGETEFAVDEWIQDAESLINTVTRKNWTDVYSTLNVDKKYLLRKAASDIAAINAITYDMSGFPSRVHAEDKINVLRDSYLFILALLRDKKREDFVNAA